MRMTSSLFFLMSAFTGLACGGFGEGEGGMRSVATSTCPSGQQWAGGNEGSGLMHPGTDCNACHRSSREAPTFELAGTVYPDTSSADDCAGVSGVNVKITDANSQVFNLTTNAAGNFYMTSRNGTLALPYTIILSKDGRERIMAGEQSNTSCASCHTSSSVQGAPGRVQAP